MESHLLSCPLLVIAWKLFKGISPTMVALLAIYLNDRNARKRDIKNKLIDMKYNMLSEALKILLNLEAELIHLMKKVASLTRLTKEIESLSGADRNERIVKMEKLVHDSYDTLNFLLMQELYFTNSGMLIEHVYDIKVFDDKFHKELNEFHDNIRKLLDKAVESEVRRDELIQCYNPFNEQININKAIILKYLKLITI